MNINTIKKDIIRKKILHPHFYNKLELICYIILFINKNEYFYGDVFDFVKLLNKMSNDNCFDVIPVSEIVFNSNILNCLLEYNINVLIMNPKESFEDMRDTKILIYAKNMNNSIETIQQNMTKQEQYLDKINNMIQKNIDKINKHFNKLFKG